MSSKKFFSSLKIVTLLLFMAVMIFIFHSQVGVFWKNTVEHIAITSEKHSEILYSWFIPKMKLVDMISDDLNYFDITDTEDLEKYFTHITKSNAIAENVMATYIATEDKVIIFDSGQSVPDWYDPTLRVWYISAIANAGNATISEPYVDILTGELILTMCKTVQLNNGMNGVIGVDFALTDIIDYVSSIRSYTNGTSFLLTGTGNIIIHGNADLLPMKIDENVFFSNYYDIETSKINSVHVDNPRMILERTVVNGIEHYVSKIEIEEIGWFYGSEIPISDFNESLFSITIPLVITLVCGFFVFLLVIIFNMVHERELRETNNQINDALIKAEKATQSKSNFLATMSHEIRTPMNAILGIAQIQMQNQYLPDDYSDATEKIYNSGINLLGIINDILDLSKIETGKLELNPVKYETPDFIHDAVQLNIVRIGSKPLEFVLDADKNLPSRFIGDELRLKQVLNNLLSNAIKYTEKGYVRLTITHTPQNDGFAVLRFVIEDTGQGMKPEDLQNLFMEYTRFNIETNRTTEGAGLGLGIAKNLVEMMNGSIHVESEYGKGSKFIAEVKQQTVECDAIGAETARNLSNFEFISNKKRNRRKTVRDIMPYGKVLIVDDLDINLYVAEGLLSPYKLNVEMVNSGFETIELVKSGKVYDIIFIDHMMPEMDGIETTKKLRQLGYTGSIVALTANAVVGCSEMFMENGFDGFVSKPIDIHQITIILNKFIRDKHPDEAKKYVPENRQ